MVRRSNVASGGLPGRRWGLRQSLVFILRRHRFGVERPQSGLAASVLSDGTRPPSSRSIEWGGITGIPLPHRTKSTSCRRSKCSLSRRCTRSGWRTSALCSSEPRPTGEAAVNPPNAIKTRARASTSRARSNSETVARSTQIAPDRPHLGRSHNDRLNMGAKEVVSR